MPRNRASVPSVTTSDGSPKAVTSVPFSSPATAPTPSTAAIDTASGQPACSSTPRTTLDSASVLATERSISLATINSTIGRVSKARSETPAAAWEMLNTVAKCGTKITA